MKKLNIPCSFGSDIQKIDFYIGNPKPDNHPIQSQRYWLSSERGGSVSDEILDSLKNLHELSKNNGVDFSDLCSYAVETANSYEESESNQTDSNDYLEEDIKAVAPQMQEGFDQAGLEYQQQEVYEQELYEEDIKAVAPQMQEGFDQAGLEYQQQEVYQDHQSNEGESQ